MMIKRPYYTKIAVYFLIIFLCLQKTTVFSQKLPLLPTPQQIIEQKGVFNMNEFVPVFQRRNASIEEQKSIWMLCEGFENIFGTPLKVTDREKGSIIVLRNLSTEIPTKKEEKMILPIGEEGYQLNIMPEKIEIIANSNVGLFYGSQTLLQIFRNTSVTGAIRCMTINDVPSSSTRYLCYNWDSEHIPAFNYIKQLIQYAAHFKFNGIAFLNDSLSSPFAEMELFYLKKFAEQYHINIITATRQFLEVQILNINMKNKIYLNFQQSSKTIFHFFTKGEKDKTMVFHNSGYTLFIDGWYAMLWNVELLWNYPKENSLTIMEERRLQYERSIDRQFFDVDFALCEQLKFFDSLQIISLSQRDFWRSVITVDTLQIHNPSNNRFVLTQALTLEKKLQFLSESVHIAHDEALYSIIFALQRAGFIALKNLLQESLTQQTTDQNAIKESVALLLENIRHLKKAHQTLWTIENSNAFPNSIAQKYDQMIAELETFEF